MAKQILGAVMTHGTATCMARIVGHMNEAISRVDIKTIAYSVYRLSGEPPTRSAVASHQAVAVAVADAMPAALTATPPWTKDATGYNFLHVIPITDNPAFTAPLARYVVDYTLTPHAGEPIVQPFVLRTPQ